MLSFFPTLQGFICQPPLLQHWTCPTSWKKVPSIYCIRLAFSSLLPLLTFYSAPPLFFFSLLPFFIFITALRHIFIVFSFIIQGSVPLPPSFAVFPSFSVTFSSAVWCQLFLLLFPLLLMINTIIHHHLWWPMKLLLQVVGVADVRVR